MVLRRGGIFALREGRSGGAFAGMVEVMGRGLKVVVSVVLLLR